MKHKGKEVEEEYESEEHQEPDYYYCNCCNSTQIKNNGYCNRCGLYNTLEEEYF